MIWIYRAVLAGFVVYMTWDNEAGPGDPWEYYGTCTPDQLEQESAQAEAGGKAGGKDHTRSVKLTITRPDGTSETLSKAKGVGPRGIYWTD